MKLFVLQIITILLLFSSQCVQKKEVSNKNLKSLNDKPQYSQNIQVDNLIKIEPDEMLKRIKGAENAIKKTSESFNLQSLQEKKLVDNELEIRIWGEGIENSSVNCFILHKKNEVWEASLISAGVDDDGKYEKTKQGKTIINKQSLSFPKSGWESLSDYLIKMNIFTPLPYSLDTQEKRPIPDERTIDLEIKEGKRYNLVFYREFTDTKDGKLIISVCNHLETEFNVTIGCEN